MAYSKSDKDEIRLNNIDMINYEEKSLSTNQFQKLDEGTPWFNYFLCGYKGALTEIGSEDLKPTGMKVFIDSTVPVAAGVSSSSAMVVCAALLALHANSLLEQMTKKGLSELCVLSERLIGLNSGGMDQTISIMGNKNQAKYIEF